jgi:hypothetical protein
MFRNRWQDENDVVVSIQTKNTRGWHKANTDGSVIVWAQGKKLKFGKLRTDVTMFRGGWDGSGIVKGKDGTCLAVDFSGLSGAEAMLAMTGPGAPGENTVKLRDTTVSFLLLTDGKPPEPKVDGDVIVVGDQWLAVENGEIRLGKMAVAWDAR